MTRPRFVPEALSWRDFGDAPPRTPGAFLLLFLRRAFWPHALAYAFTTMSAMGLMGMEPLALRNLIRALQAVEGGPSADWSAEVWRWTIMLGLLWIGSALFNRATEAVDARTTPVLRAAVQSYLFSYLIEHAPRFFQDNFAGRLGQKIKQAPDSCMSLVSTVANDVVRIIVILTIGLVLLAQAHWGFAAMLLGWTALFLAASSLFARRLLRLAETFSDSVSQVGGRMVDAISNADLVRSFAAAGRERRGLAEVLARECRTAQDLRWFLIALRLVQYNATLAFQIGLIALAVSEVVAGRMGAGDFVMAFSLANLVAINVWNLSGRLVDWFEHMGILGEAIGLLTQPHEIVDRPDAVPLRVGEGAISFRGVSFRHGDGTRVFEDLDLTVRGGETVALVGPSGAGKSTLVKLLRRHYEPQAGVIRIDGQDVAAVTQDSLNRAIAEVPQSPGLFHRGIGENIAYARPEAGMDEVILAARRAHCDEFVMRRAGGWDTLVGEQGLKLSGGERQRVAIARAFLKDAPILVLDEATSALDSETEHLIQESLRHLLKGRTVIAIAHRLSTIRHADRVLYLEAGAIVEQGAHDELVARGGRYAALWARQSGGFLPLEAAQG
ncbi:MAG: ABC transporter ATP-binding protein [Alphaproteobacteria bacterium]|nr:ABC transporter ATP-binding protein [Alphaproteobacteria bacterium]